MSPTNILFIVLGAAALLAGVTMLVSAIRGQPGEVPRHTVMLIAGMMATAFGLLMMAFAISAATFNAPEYGAAR